MGSGLAKTSWKGLGWLICILAALFYCYEYLLRIEPSIMMRPLMYNFHIDATSFGFLVGLYYYAYTPMQLVVGVLTDYFGPKRVLTLAIICCACGALVFSTSHVYWVAAVGRILIGIGSAFAFVGVLKLAAMWLNQRYFAVFVGITTSLGMLGAMIGDVGLARAVHNYGWHAVVLVSAGVGFILLPIFFLVVKEKVTHLEESETFKGVLYGFIELIRNKQIWFCGLIGFCFYLSLSAFAELWGVPFLRAHAVVNHQLAATLNSMVFLGWFVGSPTWGWLSNVMKSRRYPIIIGGLFAAALVAVIIMLPNLSALAMGVLLFLFGFFASAENLAFVVAREHVRVGLAATAMGLVNLLIMLSGMIFQPLLGRMLDWHWSHQMLNGIRIYSLHDYQLTLMILPFGMLCAAVLGFLLNETYGISNAKHLQ